MVNQLSIYLNLACLNFDTNQARSGSSNSVLDRQSESIDDVEIVVAVDNSLVVDALHDVDDGDDDVVHDVNDELMVDENAAFEFVVVLVVVVVVVEY